MYNPALMKQQGCHHRFFMCCHCLCLTSCFAIVWVLCFFPLTAVLWPLQSQSHMRCLHILSTFHCGSISKTALASILKGHAQCHRLSWAMHTCEIALQVNRPRKCACLECFNCTDIYKTIQASFSESNFEKKIPAVTQPGVNWLPRCQTTGRAL